MHEVWFITALKLRFQNELDPWCMAENQQLSWNNPGIKGFAGARAPANPKNYEKITGFSLLPVY